MVSKFYAHADRKTKQGARSAANHTNRNDKTSKMRILPHVPAGHQAIYSPFAGVAAMRGSLELDFVWWGETLIRDLNIMLPPHRADGGAPYYFVHHLFQLDQSRLYETNKDPLPVLRRSVLEEEYLRLGHEKSWEQNIFSKLSLREKSKLLLDNKSHYYQGSAGYYAEAQNLALLEHRGKVGRDTKNPVFQKGLRQTLNIMRSIYPEDVFHPRSILLAFSDLDERGHLKYEYFVMPMAKRKDGRYQVSTSRAFQMLKAKHGLDWHASNTHALCLETVSHLASDGYVYEPDPKNLGKSAKQDIEAIAEIKISKSSLETDVDVLLRDQRNLNPGEDLDQLDEIKNLYETDIKPFSTDADPWKLKRFEQGLKALEQRAQERKYLLEHGGQPKRSNRGPSFSPF